MAINLLYFVFVISTSATDLHSSKIWCDEGYEWDALTSKCKSCPTDKVNNKDSRNCLPKSENNQNCSIGFQFDLVTSQCVDIDECKRSQSPCKWREYCVNTVGSYKCKPKKFCGQGYLFNITSNACEDVNECQNGMANCGSNMVCQNIPGSFSCRLPCPPDKKYYWNGECHVCDIGFQFNRTTRECFDFDECEDPYKLLCSPYKQACVKLPGLSKCITQCSGGTKLVNGECYDIDECRSKLHNCTSNMKCLNLFGTFECEPHHCGANQIFEIDSNSCACKPGYQINQYTGECTDADDCDVIPKPCGIHGQCINNLGHFSCICNKGFQLTNLTCQDINECDLYQGICSNLICENTPGKYECVCPKGLRRNEYDICEDIDECKEAGNVCNRKSLEFGETYRCFNLYGSFTCLPGKCPTEYRNIDESSDHIRCQLINPKCSLEHNNECLQVLPSKLVILVIEIARTNKVPQKIVDINLDLAEFDRYQLQIVVRKVVYRRTRQNIVLEDFVAVTSDESGNIASLFLMEFFPSPVEMVCEVLLKYSEGAETRMHSMHQYHVFVTDDGI